MKGERFLGLAIVAGMLAVGSAVRRWTHEATPHLTGTAVRVPEGVARLPFEFSELSASAGLLNTHQKLSLPPGLKPVAPWIAAEAGASVAVADVDGDGWPDVYLTNSAPGSKNRLLRNNRDGTFTDVAGKAGVADLNRQDASLRAIFFDYDNDGRPDLLVTTTWRPLLFHNRGEGAFEEVTAESGLDHCGYSHASNVFDYDGDGYPDLLIADFYKPVDIMRPSTLKFMFNRLHYADNGGPITVYHNNRDGTFKRVPGALGITSRGWTHAVGVYDFQGKGRPDLYLATDFNDDQLYFLGPDGRYRDESERLGRKYMHFGMNAEISRINGDDAPSIFVTDIYEPGQTPSRNNLWQASREGRFRDLAHPSAAGDLQCGWAWGAKFIDLDHDGRDDLVVTNGMISATRGKEYWYRHGTRDSSWSWIQDDAELWAPFGDYSFSGYQKKCVFYNRGGRFVDVSALTALGQDESDGRGIAAIDYLNDGSPALVEANAGQPARFYRVSQRNANHWIGFDLAGTRSGRDAWGAAVVVTVGRRRLQRELRPANGFQSQSDRRLVFGLGAHAGPVSATIRWPSGLVTALRGLAPDRYHRVRETYDGAR